MVSALNSIGRVTLAASKTPQPTQNSAPQPVGVRQFAMYAFAGVALFHLLKEDRTSQGAAPAIADHTISNPLQTTK
jgi:hypothetical protein